MGDHCQQSISLITLRQLTVCRGHPFCSDW